MKKETQISSFNSFTEHYSLQAIDTVLYFTADVLSATDYYPFGMQMVGRSLERAGYRFGFNSQEKDDEIYGTGNSYTAEYWQYDARLGRRWNIDPIDKPWMSSYHAFSNKPITNIDPNGALDDNYSVDDKGNVKLEEKTDDDFDMLYTKADWDAGYRDNGLKVNNRKILPDLEKSRSDYNGKYAISRNKSELFNIFYFVANNTNVEWGLDGYRSQSKYEYILTTSNNKGNVTSSTMINGYSELFMIFNMHSHPGDGTWEGTRGASNTALYDDMDIIIERYYRFKDAGMTNTKTWFLKEGAYTVFPNHYVYHKQSKILFHYTPWESSIFIRKINKGQDLHRDLGF